MKNTSTLPVEKWGLQTHVAAATRMSKTGQRVFAITLHISHKLCTVTTFFEKSRFPLLFRFLFAYNLPRTRRLSRASKSRRQRGRKCAYGADAAAKAGPGFPGWVHQPAGVLAEFRRDRRRAGRVVAGDGPQAPRDTGEKRLRPQRLQPEPLG